MDDKPRPTMADAQAAIRALLDLYPRELIERALAEVTPAEDQSDRLGRFLDEWGVDQPVDEAEVQAMAARFPPP